MDGLRRLEYRGYDSAGVALVDESGLTTVKRSGKLVNLEKTLAETPDSLATTGIGHTRWATHGAPTDRNAHPHRGANGRVAVVHNGIIENYVELRIELQAAGRAFTSDTDSEVAAQLLESIVEQGVDLTSAVQLVSQRLEGAFTLVAVDALTPDVVVASRRNSPLVVGLGDGETFLGSDVTAFVTYTRHVLEVEQDQVVTISREGATLTDFGAGRRGQHLARRLGPGRRREGRSRLVHAQGDLRAAQGRRRQPAGSPVDGGAAAPRRAADLRSRAGHARQGGRHRLRHVVLRGHGGEVRHRALGAHPRRGGAGVRVPLPRPDPRAPDPGRLHQPVRRDRGHPSGDPARPPAELAGRVCNTLGSSIPRESDGVIYTHAGPEIGVASTKGFLTQLVACYLLALYLGQLRGALFRDEVDQILGDLDKLPGQLERVLADAEQVYELVGELHWAQSFLFLGRHAGFPWQRRTMKLKEIAYVHAEGFAAGELKHGPIALVEEGVPVFCVVPPQGREVLRDKMISNIQEIRARGALTICLAEEGDERIAPYADHLIRLPSTAVLLQPVLAVVPLQLFACELATRLGHDVDQPRNLAKSVTVE